MVDFFISGYLLLNYLFAVLIFNPEPRKGGAGGVPASGAKSDRWTLHRNRQF